MADAKKSARRANRYVARTPQGELPALASLGIVVQLGVAD